MAAHCSILDSMDREPGARSPRGRGVRRDWVSEQRKRSTPGTRWRQGPSVCESATAFHLVSDLKAGQK